MNQLTPPVLALILVSTISALPTHITSDKLPMLDGKADLPIDFRWIGHIEKKSFYLVGPALNDLDSKQTWTEYLDRCQTLGMSPGTVESLAQNNLIRDYMNSNNNNFRTIAWLSGTDYSNEGNYYWFKTREPFSFTGPEWNPKPIFSPPESFNCMYTTYLGSWYPSDCEYKIRVGVCQLP